MCESCGWELIANDIQTMTVRGKVPPWAKNTIEAVLAIIDERRHVTAEQANYVDALIHADDGEAEMY